MVHSCFFKPGCFIFVPKALDTVGPLDWSTSLEVAEFNLLPFESKAVLASVEEDPVLYSFALQWDKYNV